MIDEFIRSLHRIEKHHEAKHEILTQILKEIRHMSTQPGLGALNQAVTDLTGAVTGLATEVSAATAKIADLLTQIGSSEDPAVQQAAAQIEEQVNAINAATANLTSSVTPV